MVLDSPVRQITRYLQTLAGPKPEIVREEGSCLTLRCAMCQQEYTKKISVLFWAAKQQNLTGLTCSRSCGRSLMHLVKPHISKQQAARLRGVAKTGKRAAGIKRAPLSEAHRKAVSDTLKAQGHRPLVRGGNGTGMTAAEEKIWPILQSAGFAWNHPVSLGCRQPGYPTNYKLDFALLEQKVGLEVDGQSHSLQSRKAQDRKKEAKLRELGWFVFRVTNQQVRSLSTTCTLQDLMTIMPAEFLSIIAKTSRISNRADTASSSS